MSILIGLGHRSEHGKDTAANAMVTYLKSRRPDLKIIKMPWAWKLKDICHQLYGHLGLREPEFYETDEGRKLRNVKLPGINKTPVEIWIDMGTPAVREQVWDRTWIEFVRNFEADVIICSDTRFPNEFEICDYTIQVLNPRVPRREGKSVDDNLEGYPWGTCILNDGSKTLLEDRAVMVIHQFLKDEFFLDDSIKRIVLFTTNKIYDESSLKLVRSEIFIPTDKDTMLLHILNSQKRGKSLINSQYGVEWEGTNARFIEFNLVTKVTVDFKGTLKPTEGFSIEGIS